MGDLRRAADMKPPEDQEKFVAPNVYSIAQAWISYKTARPMAIMNDAVPVGFIMLDWDEDERTMGIWRFMIAREHQRKGYGRAALFGETVGVCVSGKILMSREYGEYLEEAKNLLCTKDS